MRRTILGVAATVVILSGLILFLWFPSPISSALSFYLETREAEKLVREYLDALERGDSEKAKKLVFPGYFNEVTLWPKGEKRISLEDGTRILKDNISYLRVVGYEFPVYSSERGLNQDVIYVIVNVYLKTPKTLVDNPEVEAKGDSLRFVFHLERRMTSLSEEGRKAQKISWAEIKVIW